MPIEIPKPVVGNTINDIISIFTPSTNTVIEAFGIVATSLLNQAVGRFLGFENNQVIQQNIQRLPQHSTTEDNPNINQAVGNLINGNQRTFLPDAYPDGRGGFSNPSGFWNKRLSSVTNLPVMSSLTFVGTSYTALSGQVITIPTITFEMVMISMKKGKNIEFTEIAGRDNGSVKEYISSKDWEIEIRAIIVASQNVSDDMQQYYQTGKYPEENMEMIDLLLNAPIAIQVICPYINKRCSNGQPTFLVIDDGVPINQVDGEYEIQRLVLPCRTDNPLIVKVVS